jgi:hypothetical protein
MKARALGLPQLAPRYEKALRGAIDLANSLTEPDAIVVCGSIVTASRTGTTPDAGSDLDVYVLHAEAWRQRVQRRIDGVPCELFINPVEQVRRYFVEEGFAGRPVTAQMFAEGAIVYDPLGRAAALAAEAQAQRAAGFHPGESELARRRYRAAGLLDDARDLLMRDPTMSELLLGQALAAMLDYAFAASGQWLPPPKARAALLMKLDPASGTLLAAGLRDNDLAGKLRMAERLADRLLGVRGFFDWVGPREQAISSGL